MRSNRAELALLRGKDTPDALERWTTAFGEGNREITERYREIFGRLFGAGERSPAYIGRYSPETQRKYAHAVEEFFEWLTRARGRVTLPRDVTRKDVEDYAEWLHARPWSLEKEKLADGDRELWLGVYDVVAERGQASLADIRPKLRTAIGRRELSHELGRMVLADVLVRSPTIEALRSENPQIGITVFDVRLPDGVIPLEDVFVYRLPAPKPVSRSTIVGRLAALSRFWDELCRGDAKTPPLVAYNVFSPVVQKARRGLSRDQRVARARRAHLTPSIVDRLIRGLEKGSSLIDKRDAAIFWFLVLTGVRGTEARRIAREKPAAGDLERSTGWLEPRSLPVMVEMIQKGGIHHRLPYPPYALRALHAFQSELERHGPHAGAQSGNPDAPNYLPPGRAAWRYKALSEEPDAPLFPPLAFWGKNAGAWSYRRPMTPEALRSILKRIAMRAGLSKDECRLVHTHAFRRFAATAMDRRGKPIREIQAVLGHSSLITTERYVEQDTNPAILSGQNEILEYIATGGAPGAPPRPRETVVETYGVEPRRPPERLVERAREPGADLPAESPHAVPEPAPEHLVALAEREAPPPDDTDGKFSAGSPVFAYEAIGAKPGTEARERERVHFTRAVPDSRGAPGHATLYDKGGKAMVQGDRWLAQHYDPWPLGYGLGEASLLPWFARGAASKDGEVTVEVRGAGGKKTTVVVPPLPVFAAEQLYSDIKAKTLWQRVEALRAEWIETAPTKAFGLDRWWGAFQELQRGLARGTGGRFRFVPFEAIARVGEDIRAHDDDYLAAWLEKNAVRYTTTVRAFEGIERPRGSARDDEEWAQFQEAFNRASLIGVSPAEELPEWFLLDDPVLDIYEKDPTEWEWFSKWIGAITGQKLTPERKEAREEAADFRREQLESRVAEGRELLAGYFETVEALRRARAAGEKDEAERERETLKLTTARLAELGIPDPKAERAELPRALAARIDALLQKAFPSAGVELVDPNILRSALFDVDSFRIEPGRHTIVHLPSFRREFARRYDGRDSECVMRRAARGMWEHVKRHGIPIVRGTERSSEYSLLYSVMLSYIAWIVPCPDEIEKRMAAETSGDVTGEAARLRYLTGFRRSTVRILRERSADEDKLRKIAAEEGLDRKGADEVLESALVQDSLRAEVALPSPPVADAVASAAVRSGNVQVVSRRPALVVARAPGRVRVVEAPAAPVTYFSVGPESADDESFEPNAAPSRYLTPNALAEGLRSLADADRVMPSVLRMMTAMTIEF